MWARRFAAEEDLEPLWKGRRRPWTRTLACLSALSLAGLGMALYSLLRPGLSPVYSILLVPCVSSTHGRLRAAVTGNLTEWLTSSLAVDI